ncbi:threonylcarbamoyl-AMP synthase [Roseiflexus sp. AH-315-K22]|nr:threonylcarbamoyl-AMP synthase [Roseiflexus sp. AH-315-K22]
MQPADPALIPALINEAAARLDAGELVAFATETVYGLGADALNERAVAKVFKTKRRPPTNPLIVHVADTEMAATVTRQWPDAAARVARAFWPGPVSIILPKGDTIPAIVTAHSQTVAIRCPDHPIALALIRALGRPVVAPSANRSGCVSPTTAEHVAASFPDADFMILDGGPCQRGIESTVLSLVHTQPTILRPGAISAMQLADVLGQPVVQRASGRDPGSAEHETQAVALSPGMLASHYAPDCAVALFDPGAFEAIRTATIGPIVALVIHDRPDLVPPSHLHVMPETAAEYARVLYAALRQADDRHPSLIAIEAPPCSKHGATADESNDPEDALWQAILDRLHRAAAER